MKVKKVSSLDGFITIEIGETNAYFNKIRNPKGSDDFGLGKFYLLVNVTAGKELLYIPVSVASGRKSTGFIYQIEGTASSVADAEITLKSKDVMTVTSGSISYAKIPAGKTATFKVLAEVTAPLRKEYRLVISRINYKLNPSDLRYKRFVTEIGSEVLKFR